MINLIISECSKLAEKEYKTRHDKVDKIIRWELGKTFKFEHANKWYRHNLVSFLKNDTPMGFWHTNGSPNLGQTTRPYNNQQKIRKHSKLLTFMCLADHRIKLNENKKKNKYLNLTRNWKKTVEHESDLFINYGTITKRLLKGLEDLEFGGPVENIQTTTLFRTAKIRRRVLEIWGDLLWLKLLWITLKE